MSRSSENCNKEVEHIDTNKKSSSTGIKNAMNEVIDVDAIKKKIFLMVVVKDISMI